MCVTVCYYRRSKFDHLDKAFCILKLPKDVCIAVPVGDKMASGVGDTDEHVFRRVDFIVAPLEQYPFALVSWTGSKVQTRYEHGTHMLLFLLFEAIQSVSKTVLCKGV